MNLTAFSFLPETERLTQPPQTSESADLEGADFALLFAQQDGDDVPRTLKEVAWPTPDNTSGEASTAAHPEAETTDPLPAGAPDGEDVAASSATHATQTKIAETGALQSNAIAKAKEQQTQNGAGSGAVPVPLAASQGIAAASPTTSVPQPAQRPTVSASFVQGLATQNAAVSLVSRPLPAQDASHSAALPVNPVVMQPVEQKATAIELPVPPRSEGFDTSRQQLQPLPQSVTPAEKPAGAAAMTATIAISPAPVSPAAQVVVPPTAAPSPETVPQAEMTKPNVQTIVHDGVLVTSSPQPVPAQTPAILPVQQAAKLSAIERHLTGQEAVSLPTQSLAGMEAAKFPPGSHAAPTPMPMAVSPARWAESPRHHPRFDVEPNNAPALNTATVALASTTSGGTAMPQAPAAITRTEPTMRSVAMSALTGTEHLDEIAWDVRIPAQPTALGQTPTALRADMPPHVVHHITTAIHRSAEKAIEIALNPAELGRVRMTLSASDTGITVNILAERAETVELMRRNIDDLARSLEDLGYEDISFDFTQGGDAGDADAETDRDDGQPGTRSDADLSDIPNHTPPPAPRLAIAPDGIDMRF